MVLGKQMSPVAPASVMRPSPQSVLSSAVATGRIVWQYGHTDVAGRGPGLLIVGGSQGVGKVDTEGGVQGRSSTKGDVQKVGAATGIGAIIGAIAGGGKGAAIGGILGGVLGTGARVLEIGCATLTVPVDHSKPNGRTLPVKVIRARA